MSKTDKTKIKEILERGVDEIIDKESLTKKLESGKQLTIKLGIDPTSPNIHLGRAVPLLKLRDFQQAGHKIVFIIGDFTGTIGDTSDKDSERPMLTEEKVKENMATYIKQVGKILDLDKCEVLYNSQWLGKLGFGEIGKQADAFSVNEFISRDNIRRRLDDGKRVSLREVLYPLMQGYDSVHIKADVEVGGTDQRFNLLAGRELQRQYGQEPQDIIMNPLIEGLDGRKASSSWGNTINILSEPNDMYGKIMSLGDELIVKYFIYATRVSMEEIDGYKKEIEGGANPRDVKMKLAKEIVRFYHSEKEAEKAEEYFVNTFSKKEIPDEMPEVKLTAYDIVSALIEGGLASSKAEARRSLEQNGVKVNGEVVTDPKAELNPGDVIQKGKRHFVRVG